MNFFELNKFFFLSLLFFVNRILSYPLVLNIPDQEKIEKIVWSPNERFIAGISNNVAFICDVQAGNTIKEFRSSVDFSCIAWSSKNLIAIGFVNGNIDIYNGEDYSLITTLVDENAKEKIRQLEWSPNGKYLVSYAKNPRSIVSHDGTYLAYDNFSNLFVWNIETKTSKKLFLDTNISFIRWSPCGKYLIVAENTYGKGCLYIGKDDVELREATDSYISFIDAKSSTPTNLIMTRVQESKEIKTIEISPDGKMIAVLLIDGTIKIYGEPMCSWSYITPDTKAIDISISPESKYLSASLKKIIVSHDLSIERSEGKVKEIDSSIFELESEFCLDSINWAPKLPLLAVVVRQLDHPAKIIILPMIDYFFSLDFISEFLENSSNKIGKQ